MKVDSGNGRDDIDFQAFVGPRAAEYATAMDMHAELCACQLTGMMQVSGATASRHQGIIRDAVLMESKTRRGPVCFNRTAPEGIAVISSAYNSGQSGKPAS